jgi:acetylornithine deacetylase
MSKNPTTILELLSDMVSFDTVNEHVSHKVFPERALLESLEKTAQNWGFKTERLALARSRDDESFNLLITHAVSAIAPWLLFESHADTVSVEGMTIDPFKTFIKDGKIFGRGTSDTKGSGAAMLWALRSFAESGSKANNIALLFVTEEEHEKAGANAFVQKQLPSLGWKPLGIIVGEATSCMPVVAHNGVIRWKIRTRGIAAHSSNPSLGRSAVTAMAKFVLAFENQYCSKVTEKHPLTGTAACSVNTISGGTAINIIPNLCEIEVDRRTLPGEDSVQVQIDIKAVLDKICEDDPTIILETSPPFIDSPLDPASNSEFSLQISKVLQSLGFLGDHRGTAYGSDASTYSVAGIPAIVLGPGSIDQAHTKDEWLEISELEKSVLVYSQIMKFSF